MRVEFLSSDKTSIEMRTIDAPTSAPAWISVEIRPYTVRMLADPPTHFFDGNLCDFGAPKEIADAARRYLLGDLEQEDAETAIASSIEWWCKANKVTV